MTSLIASFVPVLHIADGYHQPYHREMYTGRHDWFIQRHNTVTYTCSSSSGSFVSADPALKHTIQRRVMVYPPVRVTVRAALERLGMLLMTRVQPGQPKPPKSSIRRKGILTDTGTASAMSLTSSDSEEDYRDDRQLQTLSPAD